jgi:Undecaprenyl-phosphate glucose phosphotransferase
MTITTQAAEFERASTRWPLISWHVVAPLAAALDAFWIVAIASSSSFAYNVLAYDDNSRHLNDVFFGLEVAVFFVMLRVLRGDYFLTAYRDAGAIGRVGSAWLMSFLVFLSTIFLFKISNEFSRGMAFTLFFAGPVVLVAQQRLISNWFTNLCRVGRTATRRVFVIGEQLDLDDFSQSSDMGRNGKSVVDSFVLGDGSDPKEEADRLTLAVARARNCSPDDVLIVLPISQPARIQSIVDTFKVLPASIQLGADLLLERYPGLRTLRSDGSASLELVRKPLSPIEQLAKRAFDVLVSSVALILLAPLLLLIALAIKLSSSGPILFCQDRHAYNRERFKILKFRTMYTDSEANGFRQATRKDARVTTIGSILRRTSLDELPQLLNVLYGDMSIIGPRPHAIAHDRDFEHRIANYARRHNIKPGITGWAQVNGFRGETDTEEKMRGRVEHDLAYIDHWSMWLDLKIMILTVISSKSRRNSY